MVKCIPHNNLQLSLFYWKWRKFFPKILRAWFERRFIYPYKEKKYDFYMSLGENCLPARTLKEIGLRKFAGPFDWIAKNGFEERVRQIELDFHGVLNYDDLEYDVTQRPDHHACLVRNLKTGFIYPHDFLDDSYDEFLVHQTKYQRRQQRLYALSNGVNGLFLYSDIGSGIFYSDYPSKIEEIFDGMRRIKRKLFMKEISLLLIVKGNQGMQVDFVDYYEQDSMKLFVQAVPYFEHIAADKLFDYHSIFIKRALVIATNIPN